MCPAAIPGGISNEHGGVAWKARHDGEALFPADAWWTAARGLCSMPDPFIVKAEGPAASTDPPGADVVLDTSLEDDFRDIMERVTQNAWRAEGAQERGDPTLGAYRRT